MMNTASFFIIAIYPYTFRYGSQHVDFNYESEYKNFKAIKF